jgi:hypothetical protein
MTEDELHFRNMRMLRTAGGSEFPAKKSETKTTQRDRMQ